MARRQLSAWTLLAMGWGAAACADSATQPARSTPTPAAAKEDPLIVIQSYQAQLSGVHARNPDVQLSIGHDPALGEEPVLLVTYPPPTGDPASRDVWCDAEQQNWSGGRAISFRVKPDHAVKLSVSFFDRNRVAYTMWTELQGDVWQPVRVSFEEIRPNPYFQPPDAKVGAPIDVSDVKGVAFAPHGPKSGRLSLSQFVVSN